MINPLFNQNLLNANARNNNVPPQPPPTPAPTPNVTPNPNNQPPNNNLPPFAFGPFPFMAPFMTPPPMPPQNFANMTMEHLRRLEGQERENIEARIQWLRNIQVCVCFIIVNSYFWAALLFFLIKNCKYKI